MSFEDDDDFDITQELSSVAGIRETIEHCAAHVPFQEVENLNQVLMFTDFVAFANQRLGKTKLSKFGYGDVLVFLVTRALLNGFTELYDSIQEFETWMLMLRRLEKDQCKRLGLPNTQGLNSHPAVITDTFAALSQYGGTKFLDEFIAHFGEKVKLNNTKYVPTYVGFTTITTLTYSKVDTLEDFEHKMDSFSPELTEANTPLVKKHGAVLLEPNCIVKSEIYPVEIPQTLCDDDDDMFFLQGADPYVVPSPKATPKVHVLSSLCDNITGLPLTNVLIPQDEASKPLTCDYVIKQLLSKTTEAFPSVKYIVGDESLCSSKTFIQVCKSGKHLLAKVPQRSLKAKALIAQYPQFKDQLEFIAKNKNDPNGNGIYGHVQQGEMFDRPVNFLLIYTPNSNQVKITGSSIPYKSEKKHITKKLSAQFDSREDFVATVSQLQAKAQFCRIVIKDKAINAEVQAAVDAIVAKKRTVKVQNSKATSSKSKRTDTTATPVASVATAAKTALTATTATITASALTSTAASSPAFVTPTFKFEIAKDKTEPYEISRYCQVFVCTDLEAKRPAELFNMVNDVLSQPSLWDCFPRMSLALAAKHVRKDLSNSEGIITLMLLIATLQTLAKFIPKANPK